MFSEIVTDNSRISPVNGVSFCALHTGPESVRPPSVLPPCHMEIFLCGMGHMAMSLASGQEISLHNQEVLVLSNVTQVRDALLDRNSSGYLLCIDMEAVVDDFDRICSQLGLSLTAPLVDGMLKENNGVISVRATAWGHSIFSVLRCLPPAEQARYAVMKSIELLYLLYTKNTLLKDASETPPSWNYLANTISQMCRYMEEHLDEKLTISALSSQFHISPTAFKSCFRSVYGQPVHRWLLQRRMEKSTSLLLNSPMTVLQIAQDVGYESVGQFNVAFKREYGITPSQYRKMSVSKKN